MTTPIDQSSSNGTSQPEDVLENPPVYGDHGKHLKEEHGHHGAHILWAILEAIRALQGRMEKRVLVLIQEHGVVRHHHYTERIIERPVACAGHCHHNGEVARVTITDSISLWVLLIAALVFLGSLGILELWTSLDHGKTFGFSGLFAIGVFVVGLFVDQRRQAVN